MPMTLPDSRPWYREPLVWMLIAIPATAVLVGMVMITLALRHDDGLVVDDYYKHGLEINRSLQRDRNAARYQLRGSLLLEPGQGSVGLELTAGDGFAYPDVLRLQLFHATRHGLDTDIELRHLQAGDYTGRLPQLAAGRWHLQIARGDWRIQGVIKLPQQQRGSLTGMPPAP